MTRSTNTLKPEKKLQFRHLFLIPAISFFCSDFVKAGDSHHTSAIGTLMDVKLNGLRQKIYIKSNNLSNPILLWLHGGPGTSEMLRDIYHQGKISIIGHSLLSRA